MLNILCYNRFYLIIYSSLFYIETDLSYLCTKVTSFFLFLDFFYIQKAITD
jgi:hypothetical protein